MVFHNLFANRKITIYEKNYLREKNINVASEKHAKPMKYLFKYKFTFKQTSPFKILPIINFGNAIKP